MSAYRKLTESLIHNVRGELSFLDPDRFSWHQGPYDSWLRALALLEDELAAMGEERGAE